MTVELPGDPHDWDNQIVYALGVCGVADHDAAVRFKAQIGAESGFRPDACGDRDHSQPQYRGYPATTGWASLGLMQVNRAVHHDLARRWDLMDPNENIMAAAEIFAGHYKKQNGDLDLTTRAYNGSGPQTLDYLAKVKTWEDQWS